MDQRPKTRSQKNTMSNLPQFPPEIIADILSRLPVKSLSQYKCVCKPWNSLISSPQFAKAHLKQVMQDNNVNHHRLLISGCPFQSIDPEASFDENNSTQLSFPSRMPGTHAEFNIWTTQLSFPIREPESDMESIGSCNGLVCAIIDSNIFVVLNPSTREAKELPQPSSSQEGMLFNGFGYDSKLDDYKIVIGFDDKLEIFTLKSNTWRTIQGLRSSFGLRRSGTFVNGVLHWLSRQEDGYIVMVPFDLEEEKFLTAVPLPNQIDDENLSMDSLSALGNCLCLSTHYYAPNFEAWILKEYGAWDTWTKIFSFVSDPLPGCKYWLHFLWVTKNGQVLFNKDGWELVLCEPKEVIVKQFYITTDWDWCRTTMYIESLVSPHINGGLNRVAVLARIRKRNHFTKVTSTFSALNNQELN